MILFPVYKYDLQFNITPEKFIKIISDNMNIVDIKSHKVMDKSKLFTGYINGMNFYMKHEIEGMNSGNPEIKGIVNESEKGCTVALKFSLLTEVKIIILLMYLFLFLFFFYYFHSFYLSIISG